MLGQRDIAQAEAKSMRQIETSEKWTTSLMSQSPAKLCLLLHVLLVDLISLLEVRWRKLIVCNPLFYSAKRPRV